MYSVNQSFWKLMAQGVAETNLVGVFLAKSLTDAEGYLLLFSFLSIALNCAVVSQFPSPQTAPYLPLTVQLPVKGPLIHLGERRAPFVSCSGVTKRCKWVFSARWNYSSRIYWVSTGLEGQESGAGYYENRMKSPRRWKKQKCNFRFSEVQPLLSCGVIALLIALWSCFTRVMFSLMCLAVDGDRVLCPA